MKEYLSLPDVSIGENEMCKGEVRKGHKLIAWDSVQDCSSKHCPLYSTCTCIPSHKTPQTSKCALQVQYLQTFVDMIFSTYRYLSDGDIYRIGMHLIPLYSQLCRQKITEKAVLSLMYTDSKGNLKIHPIYREIRDTLRSINLLWRDLGFHEAANPTLPTTQNNGYGDPNHYERIIQQPDNKRGVVR